MDCKCAFIVQVSLLEEDDVFNFIDTLGVACGVTDDRLYYGLIKKNTEDNFILSEFILESLSVIIDKVDLLNELKNQYNVNYYLDVKFSNIEEEIENNQSFILDDKINDFLNKTNTYYNLNDGYFEA